jgi:hypothetical protein
MELQQRATYWPRFEVAYHKPLPARPAVTALWTACLLPTAHCGLPTLRKIQLAGVVAAGEVAGVDFT